jgi:hypothetical protein
VHTNLRILASSAAAIVICLLPASPAFSAPAGAQPLSKDKASDSGSFTVAPLKVDVAIAPGESATGTLRVFTQGAGERYKVELGDVTQNDNGSYNYDEPTGKPDDVSSWVEATPKTFKSGPGAVEPITWTISVPKEADPGDHLGAIYVTQVSDPKAGEVVLQSRIAVRIELTVQGDIKFNPVINPLDAPRVASGGPIKVTGSISNEGNVRVDLREAKIAQWEVLDGDRVVEKKSLLPTDETIPAVLFPGAVRPFTFSWKKPPSYGRFTVRMRLEFPKQGQFKESSNVSVFPYRQAGGIGVIGLGALILAITMLVRRRRSRKNSG